MSEYTEYLKGTLPDPVKERLTRDTDTPGMSGLLGCPLCGNQPMLREDAHWTGAHDIVVRVNLICFCDGASVRIRRKVEVSAPTAEEARAEWNKRARYDRREDEGSEA